MSDFVANHLLFEYARNTLDNERKKSVEKALESTPELQNEFIRIINGMQYCEKLSETLVNDAAIKQIELQSSQVNYIVSKLRWHQWPLGFKWLVEAGVVALLLVVVLNILPLNRIIHIGEGQDNQNVVAEVDRKKKVALAERPEANIDKPEFSDEEVKQPDIKVAANQVPATAPATAPTSDAKQALAPPNVVPPKVEVKPTAKALPAPTAEKPSISKSTAFIYRGQFLVTNAEMVSPKIKDKIRELGGQKAGEVEIGWLKTPNVYYFHFTVPEAKLGELEILLKDYSTGKLAKEAHPRVMPDGIIRLLFTVEEKAPTAQ